MLVMSVVCLCHPEVQAYAERCYEGEKARSKVGREKEKKGEKNEIEA